MRLGFLHNQRFNHFIRSTYWFLVGFILSGALLSGIVLFYFQHTYKNRVIPGIFVDNIYIGEKNKEEIEKIFNQRNERIGNNTFIFSTNDLDATVSAKMLDIGYDVNLITEQSLNLGKTKNLLSDVYIIISSYINGTFLNSVYTYNEAKLIKQIEPLDKAIFREPVNAEFNISNNKVVAFKQSSDGKSINMDKLTSDLKNSVPGLIKSANPKIVRIEIPIKTVAPEITTEEANDKGIVEVIGEGNSTFLHSIPNRVHNVTLAATKINGILIAPGEEFSFNKTLGDISRFTGFKEAYVIQNGKTVLGDGGGVCQVSTTLFRAILNAGLPITERNAHAYRVGYYEQDSPPGLDATIYVPTVDLKFKNDTGKHILIQSSVDPVSMSLKFTLFGKSDGREVEVGTPVLSNISSPPETVYQDDPNLPKGQLRQVEYAAPGARSVFTRTITKGDKETTDTFVSNYRAWQAVFLRGTKE